MREELLNINIPTCSKAFMIPWHASKYNPLLQCTELFKPDDIETLFIDR